VSNWWLLDSIEWLRFEKNLIDNFDKIAENPDPSYGLESHNFASLSYFIH
jgi:hypothetical protein